MKRTTRHLWQIVLISLATVAILSTGCAGNANRITLNGKVTYVNSSGGFWGIIGDNGQYYEPVNLETKWQTDGARITFQATVLTEQTGHRWGTPVKISEIKELTTSC